MQANIYYRMAYVSALPLCCAHKPLPRYEFRFLAAYYRSRIVLCTPYTHSDISTRGVYASVVFSVLFVGMFKKDELTHSNSVYERLRVRKVALIRIPATQQQQQQIYLHTRTSKQKNE